MRTGIKRQGDLLLLVEECNNGKNPLKPFPAASKVLSLLLRSATRTTQDGQEGCYVTEVSARRWRQLILIARFAM